MSFHVNTWQVNNTLIRYTSVEPMNAYEDVYSVVEKYNFMQTFLQKFVLLYVTFCSTDIFLLGCYSIDETAKSSKKIENYADILQNLPKS